MYAHFIAIKKRETLQQILFFNNDEIVHDYFVVTIQSGNYDKTMRYNIGKVNPTLNHYFTIMDSYRQLNL